MLLQHVSQAIMRARTWMCLEILVRLRSMLDYSFRKVLSDMYYEVTIGAATVWTSMSITD